jgi:integrase
VPSQDQRQYFGFHDLRRGFATMNAERLTPDALQALMQHQDYQTTQRYIAMARQLNPAAEAVYAPDLNLPNEQTG